MTQKEKNMMKLVSYHLIYIEGGRVPKEKREKLFVEVYNHFNRNRKKPTKRSDIIKYMSELRKQEQQRAAAAFGRVAKRVVVGRLSALAIVAGLMCLKVDAIEERKRTKRTED